ncbi:MAG: peptidoglycan editing factor PgeF [Sulfuricurvum sp.]|nr:peptidoglycan editing factor PgeF [Sulfuricurvum sp.]
MKTISPTLLSLHKNVSACFTTRHGGVSSSPYENANLAFHVGDKRVDVLTNHDLLAAQMNYNRRNLIHMRQIHSDKIVVVDQNLTFNTPPECDALITNRLNIPLMVMSADCTPILLYDPTNHAIAAIHAGRAGALNHILPKTILGMNSSFGTLPSDLVAILGPSIHGCCYEVNSSIEDETRAQGYPNALHYQNEKIYLDVNTILLEQLTSSKVENVEVINECTSCHCDRYFSYRADRQQTGRIAGVIILR